ncbi:MAG TPA: hypothetical protein GXX69_07930 [Firmicutes bacterium]|nr:hypothetical protein [Bacillota bacterium]
MTEVLTTNMAGVSLQTVLETGSQKDPSEQDSMTDAFAVLLAGALSGAGLPLVAFPPEAEEQLAMGEQAEEQVTLPSTEDVRPNLITGMTPLARGVRVEAELEEALALEEDNLPANTEAFVRQGVAAETALEAIPSEVPTTVMKTEGSTNEKAAFHCPTESLPVKGRLPEETVLEPVSKKEHPQLLESKTMPFVNQVEHSISMERWMKPEDYPETIPETRATVKSDQSEEPVASLSVSLPFVAGENGIQDKPGLSVNEASRLFRQALEQAGRQKESGRQEITLRLDPPSLGRVHLTLLHRTGVVSARFEVENEEARGVLQMNMAELKTSLVQQGIQVEELGVFMGQWSTGNQQFSGRQDGFTASQGQTFSGTGQPNPVSHREPDRWSARGHGTLDLLA